MCAVQGVCDQQGVLKLGSHPLADHHLALQADVVVQATLPVGQHYEEEHHLALGGDVAVQAEHGKIMSR